MSIMRALKNVGIGYLQGSTDIMAQKAKEKTEAQRLEDERAFEAQLQKDRILQTKLANIEIENLKNTNKSNADIEKQEKFIKDKREQLLNQGWNNEFLDIATTQGHLNSDANWNVFFNKYNAFMFDRTGSPDWHLPEFKDNNGLDFQQLYVGAYNDFISNDGSNFSMEDALNKENNISPNTAKVLLGDRPSVDSAAQSAIQAGTTTTAQTDTSTQTTQTDTSTQTTQTDTTTDTTTKDTNDGSFKPFSEVATGSSGYLSGFTKESYPSQLFITDLESPNWAFTNAPKTTLREGEMIILTLNSDKTGYSFKTQKIADTYKDIQAQIASEDKTIVDQIYKNTGLFNQFGDMANFMQGNQFDAESYFAQNAKSQELFVSIYGYATALAGSYSGQKKGYRPQAIVQNAIILHNVTSKKMGFDFASEAQTPKADNPNYDLDIALRGVNNVLIAVKNSLPNLDGPGEIYANQTATSKAYLQEQALKKFKHHFALGYVDEGTQGVFASTDKNYQRAAKIIDDIIADIRKGENGNKGKYWQEKVDFTNIPNTVVADPLPTNTSIIPSSVNDNGITEYDLSAIEQEDGGIQKLDKIDRVKTQRYNLNEVKPTQETGYTYILKDGSQVTLQEGDIFNDGRGNKIVSLSTVGEEGNKNLLIKPYSGKAAIMANPNKVLLDTKINSLNALERLGDRVPLTKQKDKEKVLQERKEKIQQLKNEIQELYTELTKG